MKLRTKLIYVLAFMFAVIALLSGVGVYYLTQLGNDSRAIITDNYRSLLYMQDLSSLLDRFEMTMSSVQSVEAKMQEAKEYFYSFNEVLKKQEANVTELGESTLTAEVRAEFIHLQEQLNVIEKSSFSTLSAGREWKESIFSIQTRIRSIYDLNSEKIVRSNEQANKTADDVKLYMAILGIASMCIGLFFLFAFPRVIFDKVERINSAITEIAEGNYDLQLPEGEQEEFSRLAISFNRMATKFREYEQSSYAQVLLEKKRLDALINCMGEGVVGFDVERNVIFANDQMLSLLDLKREQVIGQYGPHIAVGNMLFATIFHYLDRDVEDAGHLKIVVDDQQRLFASSRLNLQSGAYGLDMPLGEVVLLSDITEFAEKDSAKTKLIATLSHELKTPTSAIDMSVSLIENPLVGELNERQLGYLRTIRSNTLRIRKLIDDMIDLAKIESGVIDLRIVAVDPQQVVEKAVDAVQLFLENKKVNLQVVIGESIPKVSADLNKAIWGLTNLLTNAIRFSPLQGKINVEVSEEGSWVTIAVSDQGVGVSSEVRRELFERYTRYDMANNDGTGLGLSIVREFMEAMQGELQIDDTYQSGSRFYLRFKEWLC